MRAIERCRIAALGGHVARCENDACGHTIVAYNSCRNRHCPRCQGAASRKWLEAREAELLPASYFHVVYTLPAELRGKVLGLLTAARAAARLQFFGKLAPLADKKTFKRFLAPLRRIKWVVYCKEPFAGPEAVLRYLSRYTHRVAISNRRLIAADDGGVSFRWKDYRIDGPERWKTMTLGAHEFIRRFLLHVLPKGFHRIRHYGLFANGNRTESFARARELLAVAPPPKPEPAK